MQSNRLFCGVRERSLWSENCINQVMKQHVNVNVFGTLRNFIPVCASCKNMRDNGGFCIQVIGTCFSKFGGVGIVYYICSSCIRKIFLEDYNTISKSAKFVE